VSWGRRGSLFFLPLWVWVCVVQSGEDKEEESVRSPTMVSTKGEVVWFRTRPDESAGSPRA